MTDVSVRPLAPADLPGIVAVHRRAFPDSAISKFGAEAVERYYRWLLDDAHDQVALGAFGPDLLGFCFAGVFRGAMSGFLAQNRGYLFRRGLTRPWLFFNPLVRSRAKTALTILGRRLRPTQTDPHALARRWKLFGVLSIATSPDVWGRGLGTALLNAAEEVAREREFVQMTLTVHPSNSRAISFYERQGWVRSEGAGPWQGGMHKTL